MLHKGDQKSPKNGRAAKEPWGLAEACIILAVVGATGLAYNILDIWSNRSPLPTKTFTYLQQGRKLFGRSTRIPPSARFLAKCSFVLENIWNLDVAKFSLFFFYAIRKNTNLHLSHVGFRK
jgi:hypothetical protein